MHMIPTGWSPGLFPLELDLNADRIAGSDGDAVGTWNSVGPVTASFTASTTARPTLKRSIINGHSVVRFDGSANVMRSTYLAPDTALTWIMAFQFLGAFASVKQALNLVGTTTNSIQFLFINSGAYQPYTFKNKAAGSGVGVGIADTPDANAHVIGVTYNNGTNTDPTSYTCLLDGVAKTVAASDSVTRSSVDKPSIGAFVNSSDVASLFTQIDIARLLVFRGALSAAQFAAADKYMRNIYGL